MTVIDKYMFHFGVLYWYNGNSHMQYVSLLYCDTFV